MPSPRERRAAYEAAVRGLRGEADRLLAQGAGEEDVARLMVQRRNDLKREVRQADNALVVRLMERRNRRRYGDPIGPGADQLYAKYGGWGEVIEAACRHADLSGW
jgi:hypothetical protein